MIESNSPDMFGTFVILGFLLGFVWALRKFIVQVIITVLALFIIGFFLTHAEYSSWWALIGVFMILGQLRMAKEALIDKPAAQKAAQKLDADAKAAIIEMNEARKRENARKANESRKAKNETESDRTTDTNDAWFKEDPDREY